MLRGGQPDSDTSETEARIDEKVYKLFGLNSLRDFRSRPTPLDLLEVWYDVPLSLDY